MRNQVFLLLKIVWGHTFPPRLFVKVCFIHYCAKYQIQYIIISHTILTLHFSQFSARNFLIKIKCNFSYDKNFTIQTFVPYITNCEINILRLPLSARKTAAESSFSPRLQNKNALCAAGSDKNCVLGGTELNRFQLCNCE